MGRHNFMAEHDDAWHLNPIPDVATGGTFSVLNSGRISIVTTTAETRTLGDPIHAGQLLMLNMKTDAGACTVTVTNGFHSTGATTLVFNDVGDFVLLRGVYSGTNLRWRLEASDGVEVPTTPISSITLDDTSTITFGTGSDVEAQWDGSTFNIAPPTGMWADCPFLAYANGHTLGYEFLDHFLYFSLGDLTSRWTLDGTGGTAVLGNAETANTPGLGGYITMTASTTDEDWATVKLTTTETGAPFRLADGGKAMWYETKIMPSSTTTCSYMVGLINPSDTEPIADTTGAESVTDGVYWHTVGGTSTTVLKFSHNLNGTEADVDATAGTLAANTAITLGFYTNGTTLTPYVNGTAGTTVLHAATNFPVDIGLTPFFSLKTHAVSNAISLHVDYVKCVQLF